MVGCATLFMFLPSEAQLVFPIWGSIGLLLYFGYGYRHSHLARGIQSPSGGEDLLSEVRPLAELMKDPKDDP